MCQSSKDSFIMHQLKNSKMNGIKNLKNLFEIFIYSNFLTKKMTIY